MLLSIFSPFIPLGLEIILIPHPADSMCTVLCPDVLCPYLGAHPEQDITIGNKPAGRIEIALFGDVVPKTVRDHMPLPLSLRALVNSSRATSHCTPPAPLHFPEQR